MRLSLDLPGAPQPWQRPAAGGRRGRINRPETRAYEARVASVAAAEALAQRVVLPFDGPVFVRCVFTMDGTDRGPRAVTLHAQKPDADNLAKSVLDGLNAGVLCDDGQVAVLHVEKWRAPRGEPGHARILIATVEGLAPCMACGQRLWA